MEYNRTNDMSECSSLIVSHVRECCHNPFKLYELITIECCLRQVALENKAVGKVLQVLAFDTFYMEPKRKIEHLSRSSEQKLVEKKNNNEIQSLRQQIGQIDESIAKLTRKKDLLQKNKEETAASIIEALAQCHSAEQAFRVSRRELELMLEQVAYSFEGTIPRTIELIDIVKSPQLSKLLHAMSRLDDERYEFIRILAPGDAIEPNQHLTAKINYVIREELHEYLKRLVCTMRRLALVKKLFVTELPEEFEYLRSFSSHLDDLSKPLISSESHINTILSCKSKRLTSTGLDLPDIPSGASCAESQHLIEDLFQALTNWLK